ncbi:MAG: RrF2 family transcriptional regulator, partial [Dehalococcoidia bacterium]
RKADYAIVIMADLANRSVSRTSARELARSCRVPLPVLTNILHQLLHHGLVTSTMGAKGGYRLARDAGRISLAEMIDAIEGRFKLTICCCGEDECEDDRCDLQDNCQIREPVRRVHDSLRQLLSTVTLAQLAAETTPISMTIGGTALAPVGVAETSGVDSEE